MGILAPIQPGGHFPRQEGPRPSTLEALEQAPVIRRNHPSFNAVAEDGSRPALDQLRSLVDQGFARLYATQAEAEKALGGKCYPAPLGDIVKMLPGGGKSTALSRT